MQLKKIREMQIKLLLFLLPYTLVKGQGYCETFRSIEICYQRLNTFPVLISFRQYQTN